MTVSSLYGGLRPLLRGGSSCFGPSGRAKSVGHATENRNFTRGIVVDLSPNLIPGPGTTTANTRFSWPPSRPCGKLPRPSPIPRLGIWLQPSPAVRMTCHSHRTEKTAVVPSIRKHQRGRRSLASVGVGSSPHRPVARHYKAKTASFTNTEPHQTWTGSGPSHPPCKKTPIVCIEMHVQPLRGWWRFFTGSDQEGQVRPSSTEAMHGAHYPLPTSNVTQIRGPTRVLGGSPTLCGDYLLTWEDIQSWVADFDSHCPPSRRKRASSGR